MSAGIFAGWPLIAGLGGPATLGTLTISPTSAMIGQAYSGTISGATPGSNITLDSLTVSGIGTTRTVTGTPTGSPGTWAATETLATATNSPRTTQALLTVNPYSAPLTALRATNAGFAPIPENGPNDGIAQTTRAITAPFNEDFQTFRIVYGHFFTRQPSFTASIDNGAGAAGDILNVTAISRGSIMPGMTIAGTGVTTNTYILSQTTGPAGGIGTYKVSVVQAAVVGSITMTSPYFTDELHQGLAAQYTLDGGFSDNPSLSRTAIPARNRVTYDAGAASRAYNYSTWDKTQGLSKSDWLNKPSLSRTPLEIWTRAVLPSRAIGLPVNKPANAFFADRGWGNEVATTGTSADPVTATTIAGIPSPSADALTQVIVPVAIEILTAGGVQTVPIFGDSRCSFTGLASLQSGVIAEPPGFGDSQGDLIGRGNGFERGIHGVAQQHSLVIGKPSERASYLARCPGAWRFRLQVAQLGDSSAGTKTVLAAFGQNDQNASDATVAPTTFAANLDLPRGLTINASNRVYIVTVAGNTGAAASPTSTALNTDITLNTATIRYFGTDSSATTRLGLGIAAKNYLINVGLKAAMPNISITQEALGPYASSTDQYSTAANQTDGFQMAQGRAYQNSLMSIGASWTGADRILNLMSYNAGSSTVNGGPDDGNRRWITSASVVPYFGTADGIHDNNNTAELKKVGCTKLAVLGTA